MILGFLCLLAQAKQTSPRTVPNETLPQNVTTFSENIPTPSDFLFPEKSRWLIVIQKDRNTLVPPNAGFRKPRMIESKPQGSLGGQRALKKRTSLRPRRPHPHTNVGIIGRVRNFFRRIKEKIWGDGKKRNTSKNKYTGGKRKGKPKNISENHRKKEKHTNKKVHRVKVWVSILKENARRLPKWFVLV